MNRFLVDVTNSIPTAFVVASIQILSGKRKNLPIFKQQILLSLIQRVFQHIGDTIER